MLADIPPWRTMKTISILALAVIMLVTVGCGAPAAKNDGNAVWQGEWSGSALVLSGQPVTFTITPTGSSTSAGVTTDSFQFSFTANDCTYNGTLFADTVNYSNGGVNLEPLISGGTSQLCPGVYPSGESWVLNGNTITQYFGNGSTITDTFTRQ